MITTDFNHHEQEWKTSQFRRREQIKATSIALVHVNINVQRQFEADDRESPLNMHNVHRVWPDHDSPCSFRIFSMSVSPRAAISTCIQSCELLFVLPGKIRRPARLISTTFIQKQKQPLE